MELCVLGKPTVLFPGTTNQKESDSGGRVCEVPGSAGAQPRAACPARAGSRRPQWCRSLRGRSRWDPAGWQAVSPPATAGLFENRSATPQLGFLLFAGTDFLLLMLKRAAFAPLTRTLQLCKAMYGNSEEEARGHSSQDRPGRQVPMRFPGPRPRHTQRAGKKRSGNKWIPAGAGIRGPLVPDKGARRAPGAGQGREEAGLARRGRRPRPRALTFEDRAELLQGHDPKRPGASRGAEAAMRRRQLRRRKRGAHGSARLQPRSVPIARHQVAPRGARLRSCGPPCPSPPAGSRADPAPRRPPPPGPRRSVPSTAWEPRSADARAGTGTGRSACGRSAGPGEVRGAGSPGSFKLRARAPRAGRAACAHVPAPSPRPRAPRTPPGQSPGEPARGLAPWVGGAPRGPPLGWGRGQEVWGAGASPAR